MHFDNQIDSDGQTLRVCEMQDLLGDSDMPSTRAPFRTPAGFTCSNPHARRPTSYSNKNSRFEHRLNAPFNEIDQQLVNRATQGVRDSLTADEYLLVFNSDDGSYDPEDDWIDAIDAKRSGSDTDKHADITRAWRIREKQLKDSAEAWEDDEPLHRYRTHIIEDYYYIGGMTHPLVIILGIAKPKLEQRDPQEQSEARVLSREFMQERETNKFRRKAQARNRLHRPEFMPRNYGRKPIRRKGLQSLRSLQFKVANDIMRAYENWEWERLQAEIDAMGGEEDDFHLEWCEFAEDIEQERILDAWHLYEMELIDDEIRKLQALFDEDAA